MAGAAVAGLRWLVDRTRTGHVTMFERVFYFV